ncbi:MAG: hypothetical protein M1829_004923 [Trizodia sp. TS-e1964]|nr:MAG: hypothetical protein M1829_004923 [Trizodia sp. TS-e1964]
MKDREMPARPRPAALDLEHGKRDDNRKPKGSNWATKISLSPWRIRRRRAVMVVIIISALAYYMIWHSPAAAQPGLLGVPLSYPVENHNSLRSPTPSPYSGAEVTMMPQAKKPPKRQFAGPVSFPQLAASLYTLSLSGNRNLKNRRVLFATASLKSVSNMLPIACEMARWRRNDVHFMLMGQDELSIPKILELNGFADPTSCSISWHDARPNYAPQSTLSRMEISTAAAYTHAQYFMHPQVIIIDGSADEYAYMLKSARAVALKGQTVIHLPHNSLENLLWVTRLDTGSLHAWNKATIDIVIPASSHSSGSLIRLLNSLRKADYFSLTPPKITIDLPATSDLITGSYLQNFVWPPNNLLGINQLTVRRRTSAKNMTPKEASLHFLETFYPIDPFYSHVLILSPQVELSPMFYHFAIYSLLEYHYSVYGSEQNRNVLGISLEVPATYLNGSTTFDPPIPPQHESKAPAITEANSPFLWQAPNSNTALIFGSKWAEFHDFVSRRLNSLTENPERLPSAPEMKISKFRPAWLEYLLELAQTRGYSMVYPAFQSSGTLAIVHNELFQPIEEFNPKSKGDPKPPSLPNPTVEQPLFSSRMLVTHLLPSDGDLPEAALMPLLSYEGRSLTPPELVLEAERFTTAFKREVGGCHSNTMHIWRVEQSAQDLFC